MMKYFVYGIYWSELKIYYLFGRNVTVVSAAELDRLIFDFDLLNLFEQTIENLRSID